MNNIFLKNIGLVDGSKANIRIADGKIKKIAPCGKDLTPEAGEEVVDCNRKVAVPGFINMHTHAAMTLMRGVG
ncbi:MAG: amidohydrolase, partial [Bacteroidales bacterium]|nr:amidohydrolase [Bacteroidales bacterium]